MVSRMFGHVPFALAAPASNGCLEHALLHVRVQLDQTAGQLLAILLEVFLAHEELASLHGLCARFWWCTRLQQGKHLLDLTILLLGGGNFGIS